MANWLNKYEQGGLVLKKKTKDNFGKKANPNDVKVSVGPDFVGLGYNTKGRDYSPAWGGQFAMGGALPGAVGFTYARTINPAPSKGKYAKKTMASAQNGQEMKFYQEGLDWTPKNISRDGSEIPQAQFGIQGILPTPAQYQKFAENVGELLSVPQKAITSLFSGKYQAPSEALDIKNKAAAIATDIALDPLNLILGGGAASKATKASMKSGALSKAYEINPWAVKENPEMFLYRARPVGQDVNMNMAAQLKAKEAAGEPLTWWQKNLLNKQTNPQMTAREKYYGQWFEKDPSRLDFYIDPSTRNFADNDAIEILRTKLPKSEADKLNVSQFSDAKILSASPETEFILPKDMIESAERFPESSWKQLIQQDKEFNTPHWLKGYKEVKSPKKKEKGGEIKKDDMGYWNPENWGEPVEIGSNEITMQGVYQPLLGISDTGDVQMMYPGEDYTFNGKKVTEYPVTNWLDEFE